MQGVLPLLRSTRSVRWSPDYPIEETPYEERLQWEPGLMHNVSEDWAVGGAVRLGAGSTDVLTGLTAARGGGSPPTSGWTCRRAPPSSPTTAPATTGGPPGSWPTPA